MPSRLIRLMKMKRSPWIRRVSWLLMASLAGTALVAQPAAAGPATAQAAGWEEDFAKGMEQWWSEGGERTWVEDGRLQVRADAPGKPGGGVSTVWCRRLLPADFELELDAHVVDSSTGVNNINLFFCYTDPSGRPLEATRDTRRSADYNLYHKLNGYIATFVQEAGAARIRLRRNPGFNLLSERREGESRARVT